VQSKPIATKVSSNPAHDEVYSIIHVQHYVIKFSVTFDRSVVFSGYSRLNNNTWVAF
jgi:hypothetical protein